MANLVGIIVNGIVCSIEVKFVYEQKFVPCHIRLIVIRSPTFTDKYTSLIELSTSPMTEGKGVEVCHYVCASEESRGSIFHCKETSPISICKLY